MTFTVAASRPTLSVLPEEIIVNILERCDSKCVLACQLTCRALRDVIVGSISLQYYLALSKYGMCDGTSSDLSSAEKLELLTAHADAWHRLETACPEKADILVGWGPPIAVSCNVMVFSRRSRQPENRRGKWKDVDEELMPMIGPRLNLLVLRVPSALRRVDAAHWTLDLPGTVDGLCIDASQDLLIYLADGAFYPCMLSSEASHPLVECGGFFIVGEGYRVSNLCVCGDFFAGVTRTYFISVWNWKTGQLVSDQYIPTPVLLSFDFLDEHHILYTVSSEDSIYVCDLRRGQRKQKQPQNEKEKEIGRLCFHLALPPIERATTSRSIELRRNALPTVTAPLPDWRSLLVESGIDPGPEPSTPPFHADPHERLVVARIATSPVEWGEEQFEIHIPARAFLEHFSSSTAAAGTEETRQWDGGVERKGGKDDGAVVVPWTAWRNAVCATPARKLPYTIQSRMIVYGMCAVSCPPDLDEGVLHVDSYLPRARREGGKKAGADTRAEAEQAAGASWRGTRQAIKLPMEDKPDFLAALCEDALLCYKVKY